MGISSGFVVWEELHFGGLLCSLHSSSFLHYLSHFCLSSHSCCSFYFCSETFNQLSWHKSRASSAFSSHPPPKSYMALLMLYVCLWKSYFNRAEVVRASPSAKLPQVDPMLEYPIHLSTSSAVLVPQRSRPAALCIHTGHDLIGSMEYQVISQLTCFHAGPCRSSSTCVPM